jgi:undecaprenyl-diphosphatase
MAFDLKKFIEKRLEREVFNGLPLTIFVIVFLLLLGTFVGITDAIVKSTPIVQIDNNFANFLYSLRTPFWAKVFYFITNLASPVFIAIPVLVSLVYLYLKKEIAYLYALILTFVGTEGSVFLLKIFINRTRPGASIAYYLEGSQSFPSGHSAVAIAVFGFIIYYLIHHLMGKDKKYILLILGTIFIGLIGFSRLYLGVHFLSDVIGGFLIGGLWLVAGVTFRERHFYMASLKKGKNTA